jgi:hypothetical protein
VPARLARNQQEEVYVVAHPTVLQQLSGRVPENGSLRFVASLLPGSLAVLTRVPLDPRDFPRVADSHEGCGDNGPPR